MHGHFCLHDLVVFLVMVWEGLSCCMMCGRHMWKTTIDMFKERVRHHHLEKVGGQECHQGCVTGRNQTEPSS